MSKKRVGGDEHGYSRTLVDSEVPIGDINEDDTNGDGVINPEDGETFSAREELEQPVWYISAGGAGAPYYAEEYTPWQEYWNEQENPLEGFKYSSQEHVVYFNATEDGLAMEVYSIYGELIDKVDNLMDIKSEETVVPKVVTGTVDNDNFDSAFPDEKQFVGEEQLLFTGSGNDTVDVSQVGEGNRIDAGSDNDTVFAGTDNRLILGAGDDILFTGSGEGGNVITGGAGADQFWLLTDSVDLPTVANTITDFTPGEDVIGFAATGLTFDDLTLISDGTSTIIQGLEQDLAILLNTETTDLSDVNFVFV